MQYSNSQILAAVLNKWLQPVIIQFSQAKMSSFPVVKAIENKIKNIGIVGQNWSLISELSPMIEPVTNSVFQPLLCRYLSNIPDESIPVMAHGIIDKAMEKGQLELMEGKLIFEKSDLEELKKLLDYNLPLKKIDEYVVKTNIEAEAQAAESPEHN